MSHEVMEVATDTLTLVAECFGPLAGRELVDVGCGPGLLCVALARRGARMTGVDPSPEAIEAAQRTSTDCRFVLAPAESQPFPDGAFDGAIFLNSLHHVRDMEASLLETARTLRPHCPLLVVEPLTSGSFFAALQPIEDETAVRQAAQTAIGTLVRGGILRCLRTVDYERVDRFADFEAYLRRVLAADGRRAGQIAAERIRIEAAFAAAATRDDHGSYELVQPLRAHVLSALV